MPTNETILQKIQAGKESSRGTAVAATRVLTGRGVLNYNRPLGNISEQTGVFDGRNTPVYGRPQVGLSYTEAMSYETAPWLFLHAMKGGVTAATDGGTPPAYPYDFVPSASTDDLQASTLEIGEPGNVYEIPQSMINTWTVRMDGDSTDEPAWMFESDWLGLDLVPSTYTSSLNIIAHEAIAAPGTKVFIDNGGATPGTTQVTGRVISASITGNNSLHLKGFLENEGAYAAGKLGRGERVFDAQVTIEFDSDTEFANYRSSVPVERLIRFQREGSLIHGTPNTYKSALIDVAGYWSSISPGDREGNMIMTFGLAAYRNTTLGYACKAKFVNKLATIA